MRVALCQLPVSPDPAINLSRVREALGTAASQGADLAVFPEATQARFGTDLAAVAEPLDGPFGAGLADAARGTGTALVAGVFEPAPDGRVYNTAVAYAASGQRMAARGDPAVQRRCAERRMEPRAGHVERHDDANRAAGAADP